jgi:MFS family permease
MNKLQIFLISCAVLVSTTGYGISFPLLSIKLETAGVSSQMIGLNSTMPALGWLLLSWALPWLQARFSLTLLFSVCLLVPVAGILVFMASNSLALWFIARFLFGGFLGMFYRIVEYWLNAITDISNRGRFMGGYSVLFFLGLIVGSVVQPGLGSEGVMTAVPIVICLLVSAIIAVFAKISVPDIAPNSIPKHPKIAMVYMVAPFGLVSIFAYGLFEDVPAYLLSVYALKVGFADDVAAYTLSAVALGGLLFPVPVGMLSDRLGRGLVLRLMILIALIGTLVIPFSLFSEAAFLATLFVWGGCAGCIYNLALSDIGDRHEAEGLVSANASFGLIYAGAAILGPIVNGFAMGLWEPHGLMVFCFVLFGGLLIFSLTLRHHAGPEVVK